MDFKRVYTSSKTYIILLTAALALLLFVSGVAYKQIIRMQQSADMVTHSFQMYNAISHLSAHYTQAESEAFRNQLLKNDSLNSVLKNYRQEGASIIDSLTVLTSNDAAQRKRLNRLDSLLHILYSQLHILSMGATDGQENTLQDMQAQKEKINATLHQIKSLKSTIQSEEDYLMLQRHTNYNSHKYLAPLTLLCLSFFALFITFASFLRIYSNKIRIRKSEAFLKSVLATTDNIVNYYEPQFDAERNIVNFKIIFANACNRDYLGLEPDAIIDKPISAVPELQTLNGENNNLAISYLKQTKVNFTQQVVVNGENLYFQVFATPLNTGILLTARNITAEEKTKNEQLVLKNRLEEQNLMLLDNRAFLGNVFRSISHVVMHFSSIRNAEGSIVDFEILFVNDRINPITGDLPEVIKNKRISQVFPSVMKSGVFEHLVKAIETNKPQEYETPYIKNGVTHWFGAKAIKLGDGVTITTHEITQEKIKEKELLDLNEQLLVQNSILTNAERLAKIGSYLWHLDTGLSEISTNFYNILGLETDAFQFNLEKFREFVHPDDLEFFDNLTDDLIKTQVAKEHIYRIITKQGTIKYLKSSGQFIDKNGKQVMVGVAQDVTENVKAEEVLRLKNRELMRSNTELESFNRVSSHDLQEPLRKIRLFISRIEDKEKDHLSESSTEYFNKVKKSVERMQALIQNLLTYSRIDSSQKDFETINLNETLEKVIEDLSTSIKDANAKITHDNLPEIEGVTFQMEQLFTNLISNALKYKKPTSATSIKIGYKKVEALNISVPFIKTSKLYHQISIVDNGIGFEPEYAEKIFEVFQRLHQKNEYSGTGIGLAICKKIIENHSGHIHAIGKPNEGASFIIYLPF